LPDKRKCLAIESLRYFYDHFWYTINDYPNHEGFYLKPDEIGNQIIGGYHDGSILPPVYANPERQPRPSPFFLQFLHKNPHFAKAKLNYGWIFANPKNLPMSAAKFGQSRDTNINMNVLVNVVETMLRSYLAPLRDSCRKLHPNQLKIVTDTTTGVMGKYFNVRRKGDFLLKFHDYILPFCDHADELNFVDVWREFAKEEPVKLSKLESDDIRSICASPVLLGTMGAMYEQDFNHKYSQSVFGIGWSKWYGGVNRLAHSLNGWNERGDAKKWDRSMIALSFAVIFYYRWMCLTSDERTPVNYKNMVYLHRQKMHTARILPSGQILVKKDKNPSGSWSTSYDNDLWHRTIRLYSWCILTGLPCEDYFSHCFLATYGDDYVESSDQFAIEHGYVADAKVGVYLDLGVELVLETPTYIRGPVGVEFLGGLIKKYGNDYIMVPSRPDKIYTALYYPPKKENLNLAFSRALQLYLESYFCETNSQMLYAYTKFLLESGARYVDTGEDFGVSVNAEMLYTAKHLWLGYEGRF